MLWSLTILVMLHWTQQFVDVLGDLKLDKGFQMHPYRYQIKGSNNPLLSCLLCFADAAHCVVSLYPLQGHTAHPQPRTPPDPFLYARA